MLTHHISCCLNQVPDKRVGKAGEWELKWSGKGTYELGDKLRAWP